MSSPVRGDTLTVVCVALVIFALVFAPGSAAWAIDAYQKIPMERPGELDLSSTVRSSGGYFTVTYAVEEKCLLLNSIHSWQLTLVDRQGEPLSGAAIEINADMPEHLHGMTTKPQVSESRVPGQYVVSGMNFHMPGWWKITVDASRGGGRDLAYFNILVGEGYCHAESH